jgi:ketosteroid isomerase-like protein
MTTATKPKDAKPKDAQPAEVRQKDTKQKGLIARERKFWEAIRDADAKALASMTADTYIFVMSEGIYSFKRDEFVNMMTRGSFRMLDFDIDLDNATIRELGRDAAAIMFKSHWTFEREGKREEASNTTTAVWITEGGKWRCAFDAETRPS